MKKPLNKLAEMEDSELRAWMRKIWDRVYPNQVSAWYDQWETALWENVKWSDAKTEEAGYALKSALDELNARMRRITCTILRQPPYQAIRP